MLYRDLLNNALKSSREAFLDYSKAQGDEVRVLAGLLEEMTSLPADEILSRLGEAENTGGLPSAEFEGSGEVIVPFAEVWNSHEEARRWAASVLEGRTTFAADGSQVYAGKETSLPVGAVQIGWFENPHDPGRDYVKDAEFHLLTPSDLLSSDEEPADPETRIGERRFYEEVEKTHEFLERKSGWRESVEPMPLAFFDGTLLISFALPQTRLQKGFIEAMVGLVAASKRSGVPLVGYVDRSLSRDIVSLLSEFGHLETERRFAISDAALLGAVAPRGWGSRTKFIYSNRRGMGAFDDRSTGRSSVGFCYLSTSAAEPPARIDVPSWIYEAGLLDEVADVVRAECVIGLGYPYPIEAADAAALITKRDKDVFLRALQDFAGRERLNFSVSRKDRSKKRRR